MNDGNNLKQREYVTAKHVINIPHLRHCVRLAIGMFDF
jgi:hypothetical protein